MMALTSTTLCRVARPPILLGAALAALLALGACAQRSADAPSAEPSAGQTPSGEVAAPSYRYDEPAQETSPLIYDDAATQPGQRGRDEGYQEANEQCDAYARAVVAQDRRIRSDRDTMRSSRLGSTPMSSLSRSMRDHGDQGSYERHFRQCMESRGASDE